MSNEMLDKEIKRLFENLEALKPGTEEYMDVQDWYEWYNNTNWNMGRRCSICSKRTVFMD